MQSRTRNRTRSLSEWLRGGLMPALASVLALGLLLPAGPAWAGVRGFGGWQGRRPAARAARPAARPAYRPARPAARGAMRPAPGNGAARGSAGMGGVRPGQQHLPQWLSQHQNMTAQQQENMLRREPGFNRLTPNQQQRVLNQLHTLDAHPLAFRERLAQRNEAFERLSPEGKQDVRGAAQAFHQMPAGRQVAMRQAFNNLRELPPDQRQEILNSARFTHTFSPQERHVLGSLLAIEPYDGGH